MAYSAQTELNYLNDQLKADFRRLVDARNAFYSGLETKKAPVPVKEQEPVKEEVKKEAPKKAAAKKVSKEDDAT